MSGPEFYLVWREGTTPKFKHYTYASAKIECERLTRKHGGKFHVLAHVATAEKQDIVFREMKLEDIPF